MPKKDVCGIEKMVVCMQKEFLPLVDLQAPESAVHGRVLMSPERHEQCKEE
jgi:hypothetical protein